MSPQEQTQEQTGVGVEIKRGNSRNVFDTFDKATQVSVAIVDADGNILGKNIDPKLGTEKICIRSAGKPLAASALQHSGAAEFFGLEPRHLAFASGSHMGEHLHKRTGMGIVRKINDALGFTLITLNDFKNTHKDGSEKSLDKKTWKNLSLSRRNSTVFNEIKVVQKIVPSEGALEKLKHPCSGQHGGLLALATFLELQKWAQEEGKNTDVKSIKEFVETKKNGDFIKERMKNAVKEYYHEGNATHQYLKDFTRKILGVSEQDVDCATDGCNSAAFTMNIERAAQAYALLAGGGDKNNLAHASCSTVGQAIRFDPDQVHGEEHFDSKLAHMGYVTKWGVGGVQIAGIPAGKAKVACGIALKVSSGDQLLAYNTMTKVLHELGLLCKKDLDRPLENSEEQPWNPRWGDGTKTAPVSFEFAGAMNRGADGKTIHSDATRIVFAEKTLEFLEGVRKKISISNEIKPVSEEKQEKANVEVKISPPHQREIARFVLEKNDVEYFRKDRPGWHKNSSAGFSGFKTKGHSIKSNDENTLVFKKGVEKIEIKRGALSQVSGNSMLSKDNEYYFEKMEGGDKYIVRECEPRSLMQSAANKLSREFCNSSFR